MPHLPSRPIPRDVLVLHESRWNRGTLVHQYREDRGEWRAVVRYTTGVMENRAKVCPVYRAAPDRRRRRRSGDTMVAVTYDGSTTAVDLGAVLFGAAWQRCRVHFTCATSSPGFPKANSEMVAAESDRVRPGGR